MSTHLDILRAARTCDTPASIASAAGVSHRTVIRAIDSLARMGLVTVATGGGRGRETRVAISDKGAEMCQLSEIPGRVYEDPADLVPGAEYTRAAGDLDAVRQDRAAMMARRDSWRVKVTR